VFRDLGGRYIEQLGTGVRLFPARGTGRIARVMEAHGLPRPRFDVVGSEFRLAQGRAPQRRPCRASQVPACPGRTDRVGEVTLTGPGDRFMEERKELPSRAMEFNERQVEAAPLPRPLRYQGRSATKAVLYTGERGRLTNRGCRDLTGIGRRWATKELQGGLWRQKRNNERQSGQGSDWTRQSDS
jgi:predicted HTH transcriptional regulator